MTTEKPKSTKQKFDPTKYKIEEGIPPLPMSDRKKWLMSLKQGSSFVLEVSEYSIFQSAAKDLRKVFKEFQYKFTREDEEHYRFHRVKQESEDDEQSLKQEEK